jgi:hypothetical protein
MIHPFLYRLRRIRSVRHIAAILLLFLIAASGVGIGSSGHTSDEVKSALPDMIR